jgi:hypothetical protein
MDDELNPSFSGLAIREEYKPQPIYVRQKIATG